MGKKFWIRIQTCILLVGMTLYLGGCKNSISQAVVDTFTQEEYINNFYGKGTETEYINGKPVQEIEFVEWKGNNDRYRLNMVGKLDKDYYEAYSGQKTDAEMQQIEIQYLYNHNELSIYYPQDDEYVVKSMSLADAVEASLARGINILTVDGSAKSYTMSVITSLNRKYDINIEDDVKINGRMTQHVIAVSKAKGGSVDRQEYWIDQQTWLIIKSYQQTGNYAIGFQYADYQINPSIPSDMFEAKRKEGAKVSYLGNNLERINKEIKFIEAPKYIGSSIYYLEDNDAIKLKSTRYIESINQAKGIIRLTYYTSDGKEVIIDNQPCYSIYSQLNLGYEKVRLGNLMGEYYEEEGIKVCQVIQNGVICDIYVKNSEMTKQEFIDIASNIKILIG